mmetsp:Transcript_21883/g.36909  ORF Transcript_21883/g.36909 Transcript_21883/m.36909 type:complete len:134 (+) Transcript_21883:1482-1883(+)
MERVHANTLANHENDSKYNAHHSAELMKLGCRVEYKNFFPLQYLDFVPLLFFDDFLESRLDVSDLSCFELFDFLRDVDLDFDDLSVEELVLSRLLVDLYLLSIVVSCSRVLPVEVSLPPVGLTHVQHIHPLDE